MTGNETKSQQDDQIDIDLEQVYKSIEHDGPGRKHTRTDGDEDHPRPLKRAHSNPLPPKRKIHGDNDDKDHEGDGSDIEDSQTRKRARSASLSQDVDSGDDSGDDSDGSAFQRERKPLFERMLHHNPSDSTFKLLSRNPDCPEAPAVQLTQPSREASPSELAPSNLRIPGPKNWTLLSPVWGPWEGFKRNYGKSRQLLGVEQAHRLSCSRPNSPDHSPPNHTDPVDHLQEADTSLINHTQVDNLGVGSSSQGDLGDASFEEDGVIEYTTWDGRPPEGWTSSRGPEPRNNESNSSENDDLEDRASEDDLLQESWDSPRSLPELSDTESSPSEDHYLGDGNDDAGIDEEGIEYQESEYEKFGKEYFHEEGFDAYDSNDEEYSHDESDNEEPGEEDFEVWKGFGNENFVEESAYEQREEDAPDGPDFDSPDSGYEQDFDSSDSNYGNYDEDLDGFDSNYHEGLDGFDSNYEGDLDDFDPMDEEDSDGFGSNNENGSDGSDSNNEEESDGFDPNNEEGSDGFDSNNENEIDGSDSTNGKNFDSSNSNSEEDLDSSDSKYEANSDNSESSNEKDSDDPDSGKETEAEEDSAEKTVVMDDNAAHVGTMKVDDKNGRASGHKSSTKKLATQGVYGHRDIDQAVEDFRRTAALFDKNPRPSARTALIMDQALTRLYSWLFRSEAFVDGVKASSPGLDGSWFEQEWLRKLSSNLLGIARFQRIANIEPVEVKLERPILAEDGTIGYTWEV